jgi:hypothetical protein
VASRCTSAGRGRIPDIAKGPLMEFRSANRDNSGTSPLRRSRVRGRTAAGASTEGPSDWLSDRLRPRSAAAPIG